MPTNPITPMNLAPRSERLQSRHRPVCPTNAIRLLVNKVCKVSTSLSRPLNSGIMAVDYSRMPRFLCPSLNMSIMVDSCSQYILSFRCSQGRLLVHFLRETIRGLLSSSRIPDESWSSTTHSSMSRCDCPGPAAAKCSTQSCAS